MTKILLFIPIVALLLSSSLVFADNNKKDHKNNNKKQSHFELKIEDEDDEDDDEEEDDKDDKEKFKAEVKIKGQSSPGPTQKLEIEDQEFEITGEITAVSQNNFVVLGQTIIIDPSKVSEFEQKGIIKVGNIAKVEGVIINGSNFAKEVKVIGTGQGRFKFEIRGLLPAQIPPIPNQNQPTNNQTLPQPPTATPTATPTPTISPSPTPIATPTATPSATPSAKVKIKANGPLDQVIAFIEQVLSFLRGLI